MEVEDLSPSFINTDIHPLSISTDTSKLNSLLLDDPIRMDQNFKSETNNLFMDPLGVSNQAFGHGYPSPSLTIQNFQIQKSNEDCFCFEKLLMAEKEEWEEKKMKFLNHFSSNDTIKVSLNFDIVTKEPKGQDLFSSRLEEMEDVSMKEEKEQDKIITQKEYIRTLKNLNDEIAHAWFRQEKVVALRLAVKVAKLLSDDYVPASFYPTLFVLTTEILDTISELVWQRLKEKAEKEEENGKEEKILPANFSHKDVKAEAQEIAKNWFRKISSIKELLPRLYMEIAIIKCAFFFDPPSSSSSSPSPSPIVKRFGRLSAMIRGVSNPVFSSFLRIYLLRKAAFCIPFTKKDTISDEELHFYCNDFSLFSMNEFALPPSNPRGFVLMLINDQSRIFSEFLNLKMEKKDDSFQILELTIEYLMNFIFKNSSENFLTKILNFLLKPNLFPQVQKKKGEEEGEGEGEGEGEKDKGVGESEIEREKESEKKKEKEVKEKMEIKDEIKSEKKDIFPNIFIYYFLKYLPFHLILKEEKIIFEFLENKFDASCSQHKLLSLIIEKCGEKKFPFTETLTFFNKIMQILSSYSLTDEFLKVANDLFDFVTIHCTENELQELIKCTFFKLKFFKVNENESRYLFSFLEKNLNFKNNVSYFFSLPYIQNLMEYLQGDLKINILKQCFILLSKNTEQIQNKNNIFIFFEYSKILHDSLNVFSIEDEKKQISKLISMFILKVKMENKEDMLHFLINCRQHFHSMDAVLESLIHCANRTTITILKKFKKIKKIVYHDDEDDGDGDGDDDDDDDYGYETFEFIKSLFAFILVSIPSISKSVSRFCLFLSSAQVAFQCRLYFLSELCFKKSLLCLKQENIALEISNFEKEDEFISYLNNFLSYVLYKPDNPQLSKIFVFNELHIFINSLSWSKPGLRKVKAMSSLLLFVSRLRKTLSEKKKKNSIQIENENENDNENENENEKKEKKDKKIVQTLEFVDIPFGFDFGFDFDFDSGSVDDTTENELRAKMFSILNQISNDLKNVPSSKEKGNFIMQFSYVLLLKCFAEDSRISEMVKILVESASSCFHANDSFKKWKITIQNAIA